MNKNAPISINHNLELETSSTKLYFAQFNKCKNRRYSDITADPLMWRNSAKLLIFQKEILISLYGIHYEHVNALNYLSWTSLSLNLEMLQKYTKILMQKKKIMF